MSTRALTLRSPHPRRRLRLGRSPHRTVAAIVCILLTCVFIFPLYWLIVTSFKPSGQVLAMPPVLVPTHLTLNAYRQVWLNRTGETMIAGSSGQWLTYMWNSLEISLAVTAATVVISSLAGYGFARLRFWGSTAALVIVLVSQMLPGPTILVPVSVMMKDLGLYDSKFGLILLYIAFAVPFTTWLSVGNFRAIPKQVEEAAFMDGASIWRTFRSVVLPLAVPSLISTGIFAFLMSWSEYPFALVLLQSPQNYTVSLGLAQFAFAFDISFRSIGAAATMIMVPMLVLFLFAQRFLVQGLLTGALKE